MMLFLVELFQMYYIPRMWRWINCERFFAEEKRISFLGVIYPKIATVCQTPAVCILLWWKWNGKSNRLLFQQNKKCALEVREFFHGLIHLDLRVPGLTWLPRLAMKRTQAVERHTTSCTQRVPRTWRQTSALCWFPSKPSTYCGSPAPSPPDRSACECNTDTQKTFLVIAIDWKTKTAAISLI